MGTPKGALWGFEAPQWGLGLPYEFLGSPMGFYAPL